MTNTEPVESMTDIEKNVMRRVRLMRILGLVISTAVLAVITFVLALWGIGKEVWVARVFENAPVSLNNMFTFYFSAFMHTRLIVQALAILTFVSFLYLLRATARAIFSFFATTNS
ncbi:MAG: hypothetical protein WC798_03695 [Candidatus Paceibacterota bacterium]